MPPRNSLARSRAYNAIKAGFLAPFRYADSLVPPIPQGTRDFVSGFGGPLQTGASERLDRAASIPGPAGDVAEVGSFINHLRDPNFRNALIQKPRMPQTANAFIERLGSRPELALNPSQMQALGAVMPLVTAYHGSPHKFDAFDMGAPKTTGGGLNRHGVSLSEDVRTGERYAKDFSDTGTGYVYDVEANVTNPLRMSAIKFERLQTIVGKIDRGEKLSEFEDIDLEALLKSAGVIDYQAAHPIEALKSAGYDSIHKAAGVRGGAETELLVFDPNRLTIRNRREVSGPRRR